MSVLMLSLEAAVPLHLHEIVAEDWDEATMQAEARRCSEVIAEKGDVLQYGGKGCAEAFNALARGIALGSLLPGGITFNGRHWCSDHAACEAAELHASQTVR